MQERKVYVHPERQRDLLIHDTDLQDGGGGESAMSS
jgi:hypothetical protein